MEKIDRLGWAAGISFVSYGLRIGVRANKPELLERALDSLPPGWKPASMPVVQHLYSLIGAGSLGRSRLRGYNLLYAGAARLARSANLDDILTIFDSDLQLYVAERAHRRTFVHAGVVEWDGRAMIFPGRSLSGKTTLVTALVKAGATYYSDEYAVLDSRGRVHPYPRPPRIRDSNGRGARRTPPEGEGFEFAPGTKPLPVGCIVITEYEPRKKWRPRRLSSGRAALEMLAHAVPARRKPKSTLATLSQVAAGATAYKGRRGESDEVVDWLRKYGKL
ncbi:MAG: hypothetical protein V3S83_00545 [Gemmatimonadota bacterium]